MSRYHNPEKGETVEAANSAEAAKLFGATPTETPTDAPTDAPKTPFKVK